jgi:flagellin
MLQAQLLFMLQQQLSEQLSGSGGISLADSLLQRRQKSGREISAAALTGRIRSDAGMLRQASRNVGEGAAIASQLKEGITSLVDSLKKMREVVKGAAIPGGGGVTPAAEQAYADLREAVTGAIKSTSYNGISLMNGSAWTNDERVNGQNGAIGTITISAGGGVRTLTLSDLSSLITDPDITTSLSSANLGDLEKSLSTKIQTMEMHEKSYASLASHMESEAKSINRQATILDATASRSITGAAPDSSASLLYYLLSDQGKIVNSRS